MPCSAKPSGCIFSPQIPVCEFEKRHQKGYSSDMNTTIDAIPWNRPDVWQAANASGDENGDRRS